MADSGPLERWTLPEALVKQAARNPSASAIPESDSSRRRWPRLSVDFDADISLSKLLDPTAWVEKAAEAYKAYRGYGLLVLGAQQVGKSTLWNYLLTGETGTSVEKTAQTQAVGGSLDDPRFRIFNMKVLGIGVGVKALDVPGDPQLRETWTHAFTRIKPQGVVFLVDHDAGPDAVADPGYTPERMAEHAQAFRDMRDIVLGHAEVSENLRSVLVLVNKYDVWHHQLSYGAINKHTGIYDLVAPLNTGPARTSVRYDYCSAYTGVNVREQLRVMIKGL
jgi:GTPase SAR1 family protein